MNNQLMDTAGRINALIQQANDQADLAKSHATRAICLAVEAGNELHKAKRLYGSHGNWGDWLQDNCKLNRRHASRYMELATLYPTLTGEQCRQISDLSVRGAITRAKTLLAPPETKLATPANLKPPQQKPDLATEVPAVMGIALRDHNIWITRISDKDAGVLKRVTIPRQKPQDIALRCALGDLGVVLSEFGVTDIDTVDVSYVGRGYVDELGLMDGVPEDVLDELAGDMGALDAMHGLLGTVSKERSLSDLQDRLVAYVDTFDPIEEEEELRDALSTIFERLDDDIDAKGIDEIVTSRQKKCAA